MIVTVRRKDSREVAAKPERQRLPLWRVKLD